MIEIKTLFVCTNLCINSKAVECEQTIRGTMSYGPNFKSFYIIC